MAALCGHSCCCRAIPSNASACACVHSLFGIESMTTSSNHPATFTTTIWHNPACGTSRNTLAVLRHAGIEPTVVEYLRTPPSRDAIAQMIASAGVSVREAMRKDALYVERGLDDPALDDDALLDAMARDPALINRPFVQTPLGTRFCRPWERVLEILPPLRGPLLKDNGDMLLDANGKRPG